MSTLVEPGKLPAGADRRTLKITEWHTPLTHAEVRRVGDARLLRAEKTPGHYFMEGVQGYLFYVNARPFTQTSLQRRDGPGSRWETWMIDDPLQDGRYKIIYLVSTTVVCYGVFQGRATWQEKAERQSADTANESRRGFVTPAASEKSCRVKDAASTVLTPRVRRARRNGRLGASKVCASIAERKGRRVLSAVRNVSTRIDDISSTSRRRSSMPTEARGAPAAERIRGSSLPLTTSTAAACDTGASWHERETVGRGRSLGQVFISGLNATTSRPAIRCFVGTATSLKARSASALTKDQRPKHWYGMEELVERLPPGRVLCAGLGLGLMVHHLVNRPDIDEIHVVELSGDVIELVEPTLPGYGDVRVTRADFYAHIKDGGAAGYDSILWDLAVGTLEETAGGMALAQAAASAFAPGVPLFRFGMSESDDPTVLFARELLRANAGGDDE